MSKTKIINLNRLYQNKDGKIFSPIEITRINDGFDKTEKCVVGSGEDSSKLEYVKVKDFDKKYLPLDIHVNELVYEVIMGRITNIFVAKEINDGVVSYDAKDGKKTRLTTKSSIAPNCMVTVITPTANSNIAQYVYNAPCVEKFLKNKRILIKIRKLLEYQITNLCKKEYYAENLDERSLRRYYCDLKNIFDKNKNLDYV